MKFSEVKSRLLGSLVNGDYEIYTEHPDIDEKNLLYAEVVDAGFVHDIIKICRGHDYHPELGCSEADDNCMHVFKRKGWYIKYFLSNKKVFIVSVHEDESNE